MANALLELKLYGLAFDSYRQADALAKGSQPWITANIGNILSSRGFFGFALEYLTKALAADPNLDYANDRQLTTRRNQNAEWQRLETILNEATAPLINSDPEQADKERPILLRESFGQPSE